MAREIEIKGLIYDEYSTLTTQNIKDTFKALNNLPKITHEGINFIHTDKVKWVFIDEVNKVNNA